MSLSFASSLRAIAGRGPSLAMIVSPVVLASAAGAHEPVSSPLASAALSAPAPALQDPDGPAKAWRFEFAPYAWLMGVEGDGTIGGNDVDFEKSFEDIVDYVDVAGSFLFRAQHDRYVGIVMYDHAKLSADVDEPANAEFDSTMDMVEAAVGYQLDGWAEGQTFDIMLGVRHIEFDNELDVDGVGTFEGSPSATDPMLMIRPSMPLFTSYTKNLRLNPTIGIGGGGDSDLIYELNPQLEYSFSEKLAVRFGYRRVGWKFEDGDDELDIQLSGLIVGVNLKF